MGEDLLDGQSLVGVDLKQSSEHVSSLLGNVVL